MIRTAVTVSLVEEARGGPFVFWEGIEKSCRRAEALGFDAIELFASSPEAVSAPRLKSLLDDHNLSLAAVGTGAGRLVHGLTLCDPDPDKQKEAKKFIRDMILYGAQFGAPAIIGSMQGRWGRGITRKQAFSRIRAALNKLGELAKREGVPLFYEPLNRYETNVCKTIEEAVALCNSLTTDNVKILADVFHLNIEEDDPVASIAFALKNRSTQADDDKTEKKPKATEEKPEDGSEQEDEDKGWIGHVHFVDSNRRAPGMGHLDLETIAEVLKKSAYDGFVSAECFPLPDSETAAKAAIDAYKKLFPR